jgi:mono/diheme cytochrome c family protein
MTDPSLPRSAVHRCIRGVSLLVVVGVMSFPHAIGLKAQEPKETEIFAIARGGQLYDRWWTVLDAKVPSTTHRSYPSDGREKDTITWRCKECHGWDYRGKDGAYGKGRHFTGIIGIRGKAGAKPADIARILRDRTHNYPISFLPDKAVEWIARFVSAGQIDMDTYIDRNTKMAKGDPSSGAKLYDTVCAICHGRDGKMLNVVDADDPAVADGSLYVGTVAREDPWRTLHKIRNGQPGTPMISLMALSVEEQANVLAYVQTLPAK